MGFLSTLWQVLRALPAFVSVIREIVGMWEKMQSRKQKKSFEEANLEGDTEGMEKSLDSVKAGKPSGHGEIVDP